MPLTKKELIDMVYTQMDIPKRESASIVESVFKIIKDELIKGNDVTISGFGKWSVKKKAARNGRNPQTGEKMTIDARKVVTFRSSEKLRSQIHDGS
ncbi:MAG TPA: integration host factor subunit alpha [Methanocellales archaeon]|nr:integration host factor subunit alpha [Methanocellales archaeon]